MVKVFVATYDIDFFYAISQLLNGFSVEPAKESICCDENCAVIFWGKSPDVKKFPKGIIGIAAEDDTSALRLLKNSGTKTVTCGFSETATLTVSSVGENNIVVSLQRPITAQTGRVIEEGEWELKLETNANVFAVMAAKIVLLMFEQ